MVGLIRSFGHALGDR